MFIKSIDKTNIFYNVIGSGPNLILLHGFGNDQNMWLETGWVELLKKYFSVVLIDIRGCGNSDKPEEIAAYSIENHLLDIDGVLKEIRGNNPIIWGWSLGATIAMHYASKRNVKLSIVCGSYFGLIFSKEFTGKKLSTTNDPVKIARMKAFCQWPIVYPYQMKNPFFIYTGTDDGNVAVQLRTQQKDIETAKGKFKIFDGLDHYGLIKRIDIVKNDVINFISQSQ
jgi:alpha-beta hydrolase superfamily lysophospholipase